MSSLSHWGLRFAALFVILVASLGWPSCARAAAVPTPDAITRGARGDDLVSVEIASIIQTQQLQPSNGRAGDGAKSLLALARARRHR